MILRRATEWRRQLLLLLLLLFLLPSVSSSTELHQQGHCAMRGQVLSSNFSETNSKCGSLDLFGKQVPCPDNGPSEEVIPIDFSWQANKPAITGTPVQAGRFMR